MSKFENVKVILYTAPWCQPCQSVKPIVQEVCKNYGVELLVIDVDKYPEEADRAGIRSVPCLLILRDGELFLRANTASQIAKVEDVLVDNLSE